MATNLPTRRITLSAIRDAAGAVYDAAIRTPLIRVELPTTGTGPAEIYLKLEALQPIGSFKIRGAANAVRYVLENWKVHAAREGQPAPSGVDPFCSAACLACGPPLVAEPLWWMLRVGVQKIRERAPTGVSDGTAGASLAPFRVSI